MQNNSTVKHWTILYTYLLQWNDTVSVSAVKKIKLRESMVEPLTANQQQNTPPPPPPAPSSRLSFLPSSFTFLSLLSPPFSPNSEIMVGLSSLHQPPQRAEPDSSIFGAGESMTTWRGVTNDQTRLSSASEGIVLDDVTGYWRDKGSVKERERESKATSVIRRPFSYL